MQERRLGFERLMIRWRRSAFAGLVRRGSRRTYWPGISRIRLCQPRRRARARCQPVRVGGRRADTAEIGGVGGGGGLVVESRTMGRGQIQYCGSRVRGNRPTVVCRQLLQLLECESPDGWITYPVKVGKCLDRSSPIRCDRAVNGVLNMGRHLPLDVLGDDDPAFDVLLFLRALLGHFLGHAIVATEPIGRALRPERD